MTESDPMIANARIDAQGCLAAADPRIAALQQAAGGAINGVLAVPPLASIARLARTLGIVVSRGIVVGGEEGDLELWVRAQPEGADVRLAISGWRRKADRPHDPQLAAVRAAAFADLEQDGMWACDAQLRITAVDPELDPEGCAVGAPLVTLFRLLIDADGELPLVEAIAGPDGFAGQPVALRASPEARLLLRGDPIQSEGRTFAGFSGSYRWTSKLKAARAKTAPDGPERIDAGPPGIDRAMRLPLDRIIRNADAIGMRSEGPLRQDYAGYAADIAAASRHLLGLVDDLGDLQAVEQHGFAVESEAIDLADIVRRAGSLLSVRAADRGLKLDISDATEPVIVRGDYRRVLQILVNLIGNAVRYAPRDTAIWVRLEEEEDVIAVIVADQGRGIAEADQSRIFEKFERLDASEPNGSGLGLYISRALARAMGGDITVDSAPGQGARFALTLPRG